MWELFKLDDLYPSLASNIAVPPPIPPKAFNLVKKSHSLLLSFRASWLLLSKWLVHQLSYLSMLKHIERSLRLIYHSWSPNVLGDARADSACFDFDETTFGDELMTTFITAVSFTVVLYTRRLRSKIMVAAMGVIVEFSLRCKHLSLGVL